MRKPCKNPCPTCAYTKKSIPGYFGGHDPEEYAEAIHRDTVVACHSRTIHDPEDGMPVSDSSIVVCTGHIVSQIKVCKSSRHPEAEKAQKQIRSQDNFQELLGQALGFDFKQHHKLK